MAIDKEDEKRDVLKALYGYDEIYRKADINLEIIAKYGKVSKKIEEHIQSMKKK
ncbi:MAG: hypothetical protein BAJALOKI1v1_120017 [Promethearchaeota archaeon]|nr:MAG: hypothetical protein BAJALOKI1v1_120017 [Candidatus Lokiarchaeota archaeon]